MTGTRNYQRWLLIILLAVLAWPVGRLIRDRVRRATGVPLDEIRQEELREKLDDNPRSIFIYDPVVSYRFKPSFRRLRHDSPDHLHLTKSRGILGGEEIDPDPAVRKVLFLDDSVAYGSHASFEEIFIRRMEEAAGNSCQLLNAGCPGWSTHQELEFFRLYLSDLPIENGPFFTSRRQATAVWPSGSGPNS
jgi:hypothetical protein